MRKDNNSSASLLVASRMQDVFGGVTAPTSVEHRQALNAVTAQSSVGVDRVKQLTFQ